MVRSTTIPNTLLRVLLAPAWLILIFGKAFGMEPTTGEIVDLAPMVIEGTWSSPQPGVTGTNELPVVLTGSLAEFLAELPGISYAARGTWSTEPLIRGLGYDRVATSLNGLRLPNGSPTRTNAPINQFTGSTYRSILVAKALPSLAIGPPVSGGWIAIENNWSVTDFEGTGGRSSAVITFEGIPERNSSHWSAEVAGTGEKLGYRLAGFTSRSGNYTSGDGREVPSDFEEAGGSLSLAYAMANNWMHSIDLAIREQGFTANTALPLDILDGDFFALTMNHEKQTDLRGGWDFRLRYGISEATSTLANTERPVIPVNVVTDTETRSLHADLAAIRALSGKSDLQFGVDVNREERLAIRKRGPVAKDYIWPDTLYKQLGAYAETHWQLNERTHLRAGLRADHAVSKAREADRTAFGQPIVSLYSRYNGESAAKTSVQDTVLSANALLQYQAEKSLLLYAGLGTSGQIPPPTERYRAFLNALGGGFELGNPTLEPERKWELAGGAQWERDNLLLQVDVYHSHIDDFIWRQTIGTTAEVLPFDPPRPVFGYRNVTAGISGMEIQGTWRATDNISFPFAIEWVDAELRESGPNYAKGDSLPELPPSEARLSVVWEGKLHSLDAAIQWTTIHVASQENDLPQVNPLYVDAKSVTLHELSLRLMNAGNFRLSVKVRNLFDKAYTPYLSLPISSIRPAGGDLEPGERIPGSGREFVISCKIAF